MGTYRTEKRIQRGGPQKRVGLTAVYLGVLVAACGGGSPLLHPARTLPAGDLRAAGGVSANIATGSMADDLNTARDLAARDPQVPGPPGSSAPYAKGALVAAAVAPGLSPFVGARVGLGQRFEGGLAYTARAVRLDLRRSWDRGAVSLSAGVGGSIVLYGRQDTRELPNVDLASLHGYGADVPLLVGWESPGRLYQVWAGVRGGFEHDGVDVLRSEPKDIPGAITLTANRAYGGGVAGFAVGFNHIHLALELDAAYLVVSGSYNANDVTVRGISLAPSGAILWDLD